MLRVLFVIIIFSILNTASALERDEKDLCLKRPIELNPSGKIPCDAITIGWSFDGKACVKSYLGCFGEFPFESEEACEMACLENEY